MKRVALLAVLVGVVAAYVVYSIAAEPKTEAPKAEKTVTISEQQLEEMVQRRIAKMMLDERSSLNDKILKSDNWHTAIFGNVEYTIYTGPGQVMATRWVQAKPASATPAAKPEGNKPTEGK